MRANTRAGGGVPFAGARPRLGEGAGTGGRQGDVLQHRLIPRALGLLLAVLASVLPAVAAEPWPAEPVGSATNLTSVEGPEPNDFHTDLSSAFWNETTRRLWVCRNGPGGDQSKFWALVEDGAGSFRVDERDGRRGEWTGFGDLEEVTQANLAEDTVYALIEGEERVKEYDVSIFGTATLRNDWNLAPYLPLNGGYGSEGLAFVPDSFLAANGFVDKDGTPFVSRRGMGGLMFVGHQNGGAVFAFDLNRIDGTFDFVGEYRTGYAEIAGLMFDRSTGRLYIWHDDAYDTLETSSLASDAVAGQTYRRLRIDRVFDGPDHRNNEGFAVMPISECVNGLRSAFMTIDGGGYSSLLWYRQFSEGCPVNGQPGPVRNLRRTDVR